MDDNEQVEDDFDGSEDETVPEGMVNKPNAKKPMAETGARNQRKIAQYNTQKRLYDALKETGDPVKLKEIIGVKTVAEVYRTLDKLTIRREFHDALTKAGITFEFLIEGIKREAIGGDKSADRLKAYEMLLKTLGLDKYDDMQASTPSSWEERLLKAIQSHEGVLEEEVTNTREPGDYSVVAPPIPKSVTKQRKEDEAHAIKNGFPQPR